jgi:uridine kinase
MQGMRLIAVVGGSGSGKSWLAEKLAGCFDGEAAHLCLDNFYRDLGHLTEQEREDVNFDDPEAIDWDELQTVLESLERGEVAQVPIYDFAEHVRKRESVALESRPVVVVEGLWLLHPEWLRKKFALSVFVACPAELRLQRRMERDGIMRGRTEKSVKKQFAEQVQPMHARFVEPQREWSMLCVNSPLEEEEFDELLAACRG